MTEVSKSANINEKIAGELINSSVEWRNTQILGSFDNATGVNISVERLKFVREAFSKVKAEIDKGNIFEGLDYSLEIFNQDSNQVVDFWLDLTDNVTVFPERGAIEAKAVLKDGQQQLEDRLGAITFDYLVDQEVITDSDYVDVDYTVQKLFEPLEIITSFVIIYILTTSLIERVKDLGKDVATGTGIAASGISGPIGQAIFTVLAIILEVAYAAAIVIAIANLVQQVLSYFIQPKRTHKAILLKTLLSKASEHLGYGFETDITDLNNIVYLPSNPNTDEINGVGIISKAGSITRGIPNAQDYGYNAREIFELSSNYFRGIYQIVDGVMQFRSENSNYWVRQSTYILPDVKETTQGYNTDEFFANRLIAFVTDITDDYTIDNFKGTNFTINTDLINVKDPKGKFTKGFDEVRIPVALGNRKDNLTPFEEILKTLAGVADSAINILGGNSNLANLVKTRVGTLKVSNNNHQVPKLLWLENGAIPTDHRDKLSARVSWEKYWIYRSFVANNFNGQKLVYKDIQIPFGFEDFLKVSQNSYFRDLNGRVGQIVELDWIVPQDKATVTYWIREPYTEKLEETFNEEE